MVTRRNDGVDVVFRVPWWSERWVFAGDAPAYSDELGAWLVVTDGGTRLRLADDEAGERLWRTGEEAERAQAQAERARADALAERIAALEAQLDASDAAPRGPSPAR
jgi:hypothetical protein